MLTDVDMEFVFDAQYPENKRSDIQAVWDLEGYFDDFEEDIESAQEEGVLADMGYEILSVADLDDTNNAIQTYCYGFGEEEDIDRYADRTDEATEELSDVRRFSIQDIREDLQICEDEFPSDSTLYIVAVRLYDSAGEERELCVVYQYNDSLYILPDSWL